MRHGWDSRWTVESAAQVARELRQVSVLRVQAHRQAGQLVILRLRFCLRAAHKGRHTRHHKDMRRITPQPPRAGFDVTVELLRRVQPLMRGKDHLCRRRRQTAPILGLARLHDHRMALRAAVDVQRAFDLEMFALVIGVMHLGGIKELA